MREEEERRERFIREEDARQTELDRSKKEARKAALDATTKYLFEQMAEQETRRKVQADEERAYAASVKAEVRANEEKEATRKAMQKATAKQQMHYLNDQVAEQRVQAARDPGASEMTPLEATLNRSLLVSIVQHKHPRPSPFN